LRAPPREREAHGPWWEKIVNHRALGKKKPARRVKELGVVDRVVGEDQMRKP